MSGKQRWVEVIADSSTLVLDSLFRVAFSLSLFRRFSHSFFHFPLTRISEIPPDLQSRP